MVDHRRFLGKPDEEIVAIYLGGPAVETADRRLRVQTDGVAPALLEPGYIRFRVRGRNATPIARESAMDLEALPARTGHHAGGYLATSGARFDALELCPEGELDLVAPVRARAHAGALIFESTLFDTEAELAVREAILEGRGIADIKGVAATLRAAFAATVAMRVAARLATSLSPNEARAHIHAIATEGAPAAERFLRAQVEERQAAARARAAARVARDTAQTAERAAARARRSARERAWDPIEEVERVLVAAGATFRSARMFDAYGIEVRWSFMGERFVTLVDRQTLNVIDAGVCLSGSDRELGLDAMPSVVREALEVDHLNITRR